LRQELYYSNKFGIASHSDKRDYDSPQQFVNRIHGTIQYVRGIEPERGYALHKQLLATMARERYHVKYPSDRMASVRQALFVVDESTIDARGAKWLVVCLVAVEDIPSMRRYLSAFLDDLAARPTAVGKVELHWNTLTLDERTKTVERIRSLPFRAFIAFGKLESEKRDVYDHAYARLLERLLTDRMLKYDRCSLEVIVEENSRVRQATPQKVLKQVFEALGERRPSSLPICRIVGKGAEETLPLPDLVLGTFGEFMRSKERAEKEAASARKKKRVSGAQARERYEQLRDKIRAIYDAESGRIYSRRRPLEPF
jgi:hypothetical protein